MKFSLINRGKLTQYKEGPDFLIIGAQKAGTTALFTYLSSHPSIIAPKQKEIHFFSSDILFEKGLDYYHSFFPEKAGKLTFEASPSYLMHGKSPQRIKNYRKDIRMIVILRDPVLRAFSAWNMYQPRYQKNQNWYFDDWISWHGSDHSEIIRRSSDNLGDFENYVSEELDHFHKTGAFNLEAPIIPQGFYANYIKRYFQYFSKRRLLVIENTQLLGETMKTLRSIEKFIGVPQHVWTEENLKPIFKGNYSYPEKSKTIIRLYDFYDSYNKDLNKLIGANFEWHPTACP